MQLLFDEKTAEAKTGLTLEQMLKMRFAQIELYGQTVHAAGPSRSDYLEYLADVSLEFVRR